MPEQRYKSKHTGATYRLTYRAQNGAHKPGMPHDDLTDIVNLELIKGLNAPARIVTSAYDLASNFEPAESPTRKTPAK